MNQPKIIYLKDYQAPAFAIEQTHLTVDIQQERVLVSARLRIVPKAQGQTLELQGEELTTLRLAIDGEAIAAERVQERESSLAISGIDQPCWLETQVAIDPWNNTALEGLYKSRTMFCTQCEAEGFRKITWFLDRPDVLSVYTVRIEAPQKSCPVLLSNGNKIAQGTLPDGRHFAEWQDPFPKPSYLFALVAGDLDKVCDRFTTRSGRNVAIELYVEPKDKDKCDHAIASLKRAMRWDEQTYGREYDLDVYMIVAVDDFNMGAMENKGLNIFNTSCVLAHPATTTDAGFQRVEGVVAHEYFHNWSGNRVTCRDWFQLSLKEGFTVYRDACFSADMNSATVKRIEDVNLLRSAQFAEDAGPLAHAVRPESFIEISNFYTLTVYEKGAEVVRMLANLLGPEKFRQATDCYFERFDGQAVTCDDFVDVMAEVSGRDLSQFKRWYSQAGTPELSVTDHYDPDTQRYRLTFKQSCRPTPETPRKLPFHIPVRMGLLGEAGALALYCDQYDTREQADNTELVLEITEAEQTFEFTRVPEKPVPSLCRFFSAPVHVRYSYDEAALIALLNHDEDLFNRWQAAQTIAIRHIEAELSGQPQSIDAWVQALVGCLQSPQFDRAVMAELLHLPTMNYLIDQLQNHDVLAIHEARKKLEHRLAEALLEPLLAQLNNYQDPDHYRPEAGQIAARSLRNAAARLCVLAGWPEAARWIELQVSNAANMTDQLAALKLSLLLADSTLSERCLAHFYQQWSHEALVVNQWLATQALDERGDTLTRLQQLTESEAFQWTNPNKVRALVGTFAGQNYPQFHRDDGAGYDWLAQVVRKLDAANPQLASRLVAPLTRWAQYGTRGERMRAALKGLSEAQLSRDLYEVVHKSLAAQ